MPDLRQLRAFIAVAEQLSFTRAAESLHLTQQTVSKTVRELERELGVELLERTTREVRLTPAGAALVQSGSETLRSADTGFENARAIATGQMGRLTIGATPAIGAQDRDDVVQALRKEGEVAVSFLELRPGDLRHSLRAHKVDFALARARGLGDPALQHAELRPSLMQVYVHSSHRLATKERVELKDFDGETLLAPSSANTPYTELIVSRFAQAGAALAVTEAHITGGAALLMDLGRTGAFVVEPLNTAAPTEVVGVHVEGFTLPLFALWPAGVMPHAVLRLRESMDAGLGAHE